MEEGHKVLRMVTCMRPDVDKTRSSFRRKACKARGTSYCNASDCIEPHTASRKADKDFFHGKCLSKCGCKCCIVYHMDFPRHRDQPLHFGHAHLLCCYLCKTVCSSGQRRIKHCTDGSQQEEARSNEPLQYACSLC